MQSMLRQFRGLAIALAVLAISAGAVFAAAPSMTLTSSHSKDQATTARGLTAEGSGSAEPSESADPSDSASPSPSADPSQSADPSPSADPSASPDPSASSEPSDSPKPDSHGALVSLAAHMPTPAGFPNHGAFMKCVAHLDATLAAIDWTTITPQFCGIAPASSDHPGKGQGGQGGQGQSGQHGHSGQPHGQSGQPHGQGGKPSAHP
jgi:hypothetical protein